MLFGDAHVRLFESAGSLARLLVKPYSSRAIQQTLREYLNSQDSAVICIDLLYRGSLDLTLEYLLPPKPVVVQRIVCFDVYLFITAHAHDSYKDCHGPVLAH